MAGQTRAADGVASLHSILLYSGTFDASFTYRLSEKGCEIREPLFIKNTIFVHLEYFIAHLFPRLTKSVCNTAFP